MKKKVLVIGAGDYQVPAIKRISEMGYEAFCVDKNDNAPGFVYANGYKVIDVCDKDTCLAYAQELGVDGVMTYGATITLPTVAYIARKLGLDINDDIYVERYVEGIVDMTFDAIQNYSQVLTEERLFSWQAAMFPTGRSGLYKIKVGQYRDDAEGAMQVVSGAIGHEKVHYEAPPAEIITTEMNKLIDYINNETQTDLIIKAGIVHLWFVINHPFEDGNGRIARVLTDMLLARSEDSSNRYYSMSSQIKKNRKSYYKALEITQGSQLDITKWLQWFLENLIQAIENSNEIVSDVLNKSEFWSKNKDIVMNERQVKMINKLLDDFTGNLTTVKWAKMCKCSQDTATRDITDLIKKGILIKQGEARATHYLIKF